MKERRRRPIVLGALALTYLTLAGPSIRAATSDADDHQDAALAKLIDSPTHPLPIVPIVVPQLRTPQEVDEILALGTVPTLFQVSQPGGNFAAPDELRFFQILSAEYAEKIAFRKLAAGSAAAVHLIGGITKPVYILCNAIKTSKDRCAYINEAKLSDDQRAGQSRLETFIEQRVNITPTLLTTFPVTTENMQQVVFHFEPDDAHLEPTAKWIAVLFFPSKPEPSGPINRLRFLAGLERFFYSGRLRIAECDVSTAGEVYRKLIPHAAAIPTAPELWLIKPETRETVKYSPGPDASVTDLTHTTLQAWLLKNGVTAPPDTAIDAEAAWQALDNLSRQQ